MAMEITKNLQTIERSLKAIKEAEFRINKLLGKTSSGKLDNSLYIIESSKIREEIKKPWLLLMQSRPKNLNF